MLTHRRTGRITVCLPLIALLIGSVLAGPSPAQAQEVHWYHVYGRDGFLGWYLPRGERPVKHHWPVTLVWFDEPDYAWYYTSNPDVLDAVGQLIDQNLDVGNFADERTFAQAIHFHAAARDSSIASVRWVRLDEEAYLKFPSGLSAYIHELGRLQSPVGGDDATAPAPMSSPTCCRWIRDPGCFIIIASPPDSTPEPAPHAATFEACEPVRCNICTVCCNTWSDGCTGNRCESGSCSSFTVECDDDNACTIDSCEPGTGCVHEGKDCDDSDPCTSDGCNSETGACVNEDLPDGTPCPDDGDACTRDQCLDGACNTPIVRAAATPDRHS